MPPLVRARHSRSPPPPAAMPITHLCTLPPPPPPAVWPPREGYHARGMSRTPGREESAAYIFRAGSDEFGIGATHQWPRACRNIRCVQRFFFSLLLLISTTFFFGAHFFDDAAGFIYVRLLFRAVCCKNASRYLYKKVDISRQQRWKNLYDGQRKISIYNEKPSALTKNTQARTHI